MLSNECHNFIKHVALDARFPIVVIGDTGCVVTPVIAIATEEGRRAPIITVNDFTIGKYPLELIHAFLCKIRYYPGTHSLFLIDSAQGAKLITAPISMIHLYNGTTYSAVKEAFTTWAAKIPPQGWFIIQDAGTASPWEGPKKVVEEILYNPDSVPLKWGNIIVGPDFTALKRLR